MTTPEPARRLAVVVLLGALTLCGAARAEEAAEHTIKPQDWSFAGFTGAYDEQQLQRGFQVFQQVCTACHGLKRVRFRNLSEPGGPEFPVEAVKELAKTWPYQISGELDDEGNPIDRLPGLADPIVGPYKNDVQARAAQNGALPPDLSLIVRARSVHTDLAWYRHWLQMLADVAYARQDGGADYVYGLLTGYKDEPPAYKRDEKGHLIWVPESKVGSEGSIERCATVDRDQKTDSGEEKPDVCNELAEGKYYNGMFPGHQISMPPPLSKDNVIEYQPDAGAPSTFEQNVKDVTAFLAWAADPSLDARKKLGWQVLLYLVITTILLYIAKRRIWSRVKH
jgi:ubiquinol-cytochrome c reductase cytochrome c1 subunit